MIRFRMMHLPSEYNLFFHSDVLSFIVKFRTESFTFGILMIAADTKSFKVLLSVRNQCSKTYPKPLCILSKNNYYYRCNCFNIWPWKTNCNADWATSPMSVECRFVTTVLVPINITVTQYDRLFLQMNLLICQYYTLLSG